MMTLTLDTCIDMMVEGRAILFAFFIGGCSGMLPWIRVAVLLYTWLAPATILPHEKRGQALRLLLNLAKWCTAEVYLFSILQTSVNVHMYNPTKQMNFIPPDTVVVDIECIPEWGLFSFLTATILSMLLNHVMIYYHDVSVQTTKAHLASHRTDTTPLMASTEPIAIGTGIFDVSNSSTIPSPSILPPVERSNSLLIEIRRNQLNDEIIQIRSLTISKFDYFVLLFVVLIWIPILILSFISVSFSFEFMGFSGFGINMLGDDPAKKSSSSLIHLLPKLLHSDRAHLMYTSGLILLTASYFVFIILAPSLLCLVIVLSWIFPIYRKNLVKLWNLLSTLFSWSTTEVLCLTIIVIVLQIHRFFASMSSTLTFCPQSVSSYFSFIKFLF
jgi:hypothetical protein